MGMIEDNTVRRIFEARTRKTKLERSPRPTWIEEIRRPAEKNKIE